MNIYVNYPDFNVRVAKNWSKTRANRVC